MNITQGNLPEEIEKPGRLILFFTAAWCAPCKALKPSLEKVVSSREGVRVGYVDIDKEMAVADGYGVRTIPTLVLIEGGKNKRSVLGNLPQASLEKFIDAE
jgi:thioredoxin 1